MQPCVIPKGCTPYTSASELFRRQVLRCMCTKFRLTRLHTLQCVYFCFGAVAMVVKQAAGHNQGYTNDNVVTKQQTCSIVVLTRSVVDCNMHRKHISAFVSCPLLAYTSNCVLHMAFGILIRPPHGLLRGFIARRKRSQPFGTRFQLKKHTAACQLKQDSRLWGLLPFMLAKHESPANTAAIAVRLNPLNCIVMTVNGFAIAMFCSAMRIQRRGSGFWIGKS
jgi:hypothetical protein